MFLFGCAARTHTMRKRTRRQKQGTGPYTARAVSTCSRTDVALNNNTCSTLFLAALFFVQMSQSFSLVGTFFGHVYMFLFGCAAHTCHSPPPPTSMCAAPSYVLPHCLIKTRPPPQFLDIKKQRKCTERGRGKKKICNHLLAVVVLASAARLPATPLPAVLSSESDAESSSVSV